MRLLHARCINQVHSSISFISSLLGNIQGGRKDLERSPLGGSRKTEAGGFFFHTKGVNGQTRCSFALLPWLQGRGQPLASREGSAAAAVPPRSSPLCQATRLLFPVLTREAHALRPFPRPRREEKGSVVFLSSFLPLTGWLHTGSDSPDGNPTRLSRPLLLQGLSPRLICLCPDRGKEEEEKPQTSFANQFAGRAWSARRRLSHSGTLKTPEAPGAPGCPSPAPRCPRPPPSSGVPRAGRESGSGHDPGWTPREESRVEPWELRG